jgi:hypothetical protein
MKDVKEVKTTRAETPAASAIEDLSAEIVRTIARVPGDQVTCRHISGDHYRCNWWQQQNPADYDNPGMTGLLVTTSRIRKSKFLKVKKTGQGLSIEEPASSR